MPRGVHPVTTGARARRLPAFGLLAVALALGAALIAACSGGDELSERIESPPDFWVDIAAGTAKADGTYGRVDDVPYDVALTPDAFLAMKRYGSVANDLFVVKPGNALDRDSRVGRDWESTVPIEVTAANEWTSGHILKLDDRHLINVTDYDLDPTGHAVAVIDEDGPKVINQSSSGQQAVLVVDGIVFVIETLDDEMRCYRGSLDEWVQLFSGHHCSVTKSGHVLGVSANDSSFDVGVRSPSGRIVHGSSSSVAPTLSQNGRFLLYQEATSVRLEEVEGRRRTFEWAGAIESSRTGLASHPNGHVALVLTGSDNSLVLRVVSATQEPQILAELACGHLRAAFTQSGYLFWSESESVKNWPDGERTRCSDRFAEDSISAWIPSTNAHQVVHESDDLEIIGVHSDAVITSTVDEFGALFERSFSDGQVEELLNLDATLGDNRWYWAIQGHHLYVEGEQAVASLSLENGRTIVRDGLDQPTLLSWRDGTMIVGTSEFGVRGSDTRLLVIGRGEALEETVLRVPSNIGEYHPFSAVVITEDEVWASFWDRSESPETKRSTVAFTVEHGYLFDPLLTYTDVALPSGYFGVLESRWATSLISESSIDE